MSLPDRLIVAAATMAVSDTSTTVVLPLAPEVKVWGDGVAYPSGVWTSVTV